MNVHFGKRDKLKSKKAIETLFAEGKSLKKFPVKVLYLPSEGNENTQAAFAVPKRNFKLAVSRNRIKRQMRECYRLHKHLLTNQEDVRYTLLFLYLGRDKSQYAKLETAIEALLKKLGDEKN